jgi:hypothetical protein
MPGPCRKPNLLDAMIVVAALAIGMAFARAVIAEGPPDLALARIPSRFRTLQIVHDGALACLDMLTLADLLIVLRRPRPGLDEVAGQPGAAACFGAFVFSAPLLALISMLANLVRPEFWALFPLISVAGAFGAAYGFLQLHFFGPWRFDPGWIDRLGRSIAGCWIGLPVLLFLSYVF